MAEDDSSETPRPRKKKRKRRADADAEGHPASAPRSDAAPPVDELAPPARVTSRFSTVWIVVAALYLATVWLDGVGSNFPAKVAPRPWIYVSQIAALFVTAAPKVIDYRAEGWSCSDHHWTEIDVRPYFRIDQDNKENRFQRALQFYRKNRTVMRALEEYVIRRYDADHEVPIVGVRFSSLRIGYPAPGEHVAPFERRPLRSYTADERHEWYWTPSLVRTQKCGTSSPPEGPDDARDNKSDSESKDLDP